MPNREYSVGEDWRDRLLLLSIANRLNKERDKERKRERRWKSV